MKNVTITLEEDVARWARIRAAERDTSVSRFVGELLRERMVEERTYEAAMRDYLAQPPATCGNLARSTLAARSSMTGSLLDFLVGCPDRRCRASR